MHRDLSKTLPCSFYFQPAGTLSSSNTFDDPDHVGLKYELAKNVPGSLDPRKTRTVQPMAVTSAPAPAPWMMSGLGEYLKSCELEIPRSERGSSPFCVERDDVIRAFQRRSECMVCWVPAVV